MFLHCLQAKGSEQVRQLLMISLQTVQLLLPLRKGVLKQLVQTIEAEPVGRMQVAQAGWIVLQPLHSVGEILISPMAQ